MKISDFTPPLYRGEYVSLRYDAGGLGYTLLTGVIADLDIECDRINILQHDGSLYSIVVDTIIDMTRGGGAPKPLDDMPVIEHMSPETFKALLDELDGNSLQTLKEKNARYSQNGDCLHNFRSGADIAGGTPAQACWGYLTKHLVALRDMVEKDDFSNREDFLEKCQDIINYVRFLWCIGNDKNNKKESNLSC